MEDEFLIDTNVFIDLMAGRFSESVRRPLQVVMKPPFFLSIVSKIEMLGFKDLSQFEEKQFSLIIDSSKMIYLHDGIVDETIAIRKSFNIKLPDAIIAASCLSVNAVLLTSNASDFKKISNLKLLNPLQLI